MKAAIALIALLVVVQCGDIDFLSAELNTVSG